MERRRGEREGKRKMGNGFAIVSEFRSLVNVSYMCAVSWSVGKIARIARVS
jgi:hypothetical protein